MDTSTGFDLCPADACALPAGEKFEVVKGFPEQRAGVDGMDRIARFLAEELARAGG